MMVSLALLKLIVVSDTVVVELTVATESNAICGLPVNVTEPVSLSATSRFCEANVPPVIVSELLPIPPL